MTDFDKVKISFWDGDVHRHTFMGCTLHYLLLLLQGYRFNKLIKFESFYFPNLITDTMNWFLFFNINV